MGKMRFVVLAGMLVVSAGCSSSGKAVSHADFAKKANAVCERYNKQLEPIMKSQQPSSPASEVADALDKFGGIAQKGDDALRNLDRPDKDNATFTAAIKLQDDQVKMVRLAARQLRAGDLQKGKQTAAGVDKLTPQVNTKFDSIGLRTCGSDAGRTA